MFFIQSLIKSCYDIAWLRNQKSKTKKAWGYYVLFMLLMTAITFIPLLTGIPQAISTAKTFIQSEIPEFAFTIEHGEASVTGVEQPFELMDEEDQTLFVIDTISEQAPSIADYPVGEYKNIFLLTKSTVSIYEGDNKQTRVQHLNEFPNVSIDKQGVIDLANKYITWPVLTVVFFVILLIVFVFWGVGKLVYLLILTAIAKSIAIIAKKKELTFGNLFTIGLFAITLPTLVTRIGSILIQSITNVPVHIPFLYTIIFLVVMLMVVFRVPVQETSDEVKKKV